MPRQYSPVSGIELGDAIVNQLRRIINKNRISLFGANIAYRAFAFRLTLNVKILENGIGDHQVIEDFTQGEMDAAPGIVHAQITFHHPIDFAPDRARTALHLAHRETEMDSGGQMIEREIAPPFDSLLDEIPALNPASSSASSSASNPALNPAPISAPISAPNPATSPLTPFRSEPSEAERIAMEPMDVAQVPPPQFREPAGPWGTVTESRGRHFKRLSDRQQED